MIYTKHKNREREMVHTNHNKERWYTPIPKKKEREMVHTNHKKERERDGDRLCNITHQKEREEYTLNTNASNK